MKVPVPRKLSSGKWFIQMRLSGESVSVSNSNKKACIAEAQSVKAEYLAGKRAPKQETGELPTLTAAIDSYIESKSNTLSPSTIRGYRAVQKHRFASTMPRRLDEIEDGEWQGILNAEAALCSPKTLKNAWAFIRTVVLRAAGKTLPSEVSLPAPISPDTAFLMPDEILKFVKAVKDTHYAVPALLALSSLRISEIQALKWEDIPKNPSFIRVSGAVVRNEKNGYQRKAQNKNETSTRNVPIMMPELSAAIERDRKESGPILDRDQDSLREAVHNICKKNGITDVTVHGLRHSFASLAYHLQIPEKIAMEIGGWADAGTMHKIYTHIAKSDIERYQTAMTEFYNGKSKRKNANKNANSAKKSV